MNLSKSGLSSAAKTGVIVVIVILVLGGAYLAPSMLKGGGTSTTSSQSGASCLSTAGANQPIGLLSLFACFSQMQMDTIVDTQGQPGGTVERMTVAYLVLGTATENSTPHTKVEFSEPGSGGSNVIAYFNSTGVVDRIDIVGGKNYSGPGATILAQTYTTAFGLIPVITNNATLTSMLSKTSENTTSVGPTQLDVTTYHLTAPQAPYKSIIAQYATIPGTNVRFVIYLDEKTTDLTDTTVHVTSITK
jgi:hypothetical protein